VAALALAATGASAFVAPSAFSGSQLSTGVTSSSAMKMADASALPGAPFGDGVVFDPLNLASKVGDAELKKWREAELKHGRVAMVATVGMLVQEQFHPFWNLGSTDIGPAIGHYQAIEKVFPTFWPLSLLGVAIVEGETIIRGWEKMDKVNGVAELKADYINGDLGFDPFNIVGTEKFDVERTKELNNGRLAMIAILGMWAQELVNGKTLL
ncbi:unnamed protein product, partial [Chrysoparadoxa australica]